MPRLRIPLFSATESPRYLDVESADLKSALDEHALLGFYRAYDPRLDAAIAARRFVRARRLAAEKRKWAAERLARRQRVPAKQGPHKDAQLGLSDPNCEQEPRVQPKRRRKVPDRYTY